NTWDDEAIPLPQGHEHEDHLRHEEKDHRHEHGGDEGEFRSSPQAVDDEEEAITIEELIRQERIIERANEIRDE
ncbi:MAG: hypothetical protein AAEJ57_02800, partial [Opitutales bacterium]